MEIIWYMKPITPVSFSALHLWMHRKEFMMVKNKRKNPVILVAEEMQKTSASFCKIEAKKQSEI